MQSTTINGVEIVTNMPNHITDGVVEVGINPELRGEYYRGIANDLRNDIRNRMVGEDAHAR